MLTNGSRRPNFGNVGPTTLRREIGLLGGFFLELSLARFASLQPEVVYTQKGIRVAGPSVADALAGPAVAVLVRARERFAVPGLATQDQEITDGVSGIDAGVLLGGGFAIGRVGIEGRFDAGLRNLIPPADRRGGEPARTHRSVSVAARLRL
jgi:hypothetical protein